MRVEIWSDVVCPWCYIGKVSFDRALDAFPSSSAPYASGHASAA